MGRALEIVILGEAEAARELAAPLGALGFSASIAPTAKAADIAGRASLDAIVSLAPLDLPERRAPLLTLCRTRQEASGDGIVCGPAHPVQIAARLRALIRLAALERCAALRAADAQARSPLTAPEIDPHAPALLYVGPPGMDFLHLSHAAAPLGGALVSAFSAFHAFDYLHERAFDAVILNAAEDKDLAYAIASAMRRNTRLYHTPAILLCRGNCFAEADEAFARGASDLLPAQTEPSEIRARLTAFAQERRRRRAAKALLEACRIPKLLDPQSGLFDNSFGLAHLESLIATGARRGRPLPIALIRLAAQPRPITGPAAPREESALTQFAGLLRHCVRTEDFVFRLRDLDFVLALPETDRAEAETVLARVRAIAECTVYPEIGGRQEVRFDLQSALLEARPGEPAAALAARALARLFEGPARAAI